MAISWEMLWPIGIVLLAAVIAWAALNNRQSRREEQRTEQATRDLYQEQDASDKEGRS